MLSQLIRRTRLRQRGEGRVSENQPLPLFCPEQRPSCDLWHPYRQEAISCNSISEWDGISFISHFFFCIFLQELSGAYTPLKRSRRQKATQLQG